MRLFLKILTLIGAIITCLGALTILPATILYLIRSPHKLVAITPLILRIALLGLASCAGVEAALFGLFAYLEVALRRERILLSSLFAGIALLSLILIACFRLPLI